MHSIYAPLFAAFLATFAQAQSYTKPGVNSWGPLLTPDLSNSVTQGKEFTVTWDPEDHPTDGVTVSLVLCSGPSSNCVPADNAIATGIPAAAKSFNWEVPCSLAPGKAGTDTGYGILIIVDGTGEFQYSTQFSCLENKSCSSSSSSSSSGSSSSASSTTTNTVSGGSIILGPPAQQTGSYAYSSNGTYSTPATSFGPGRGSASTTATSYGGGGSSSSYTVISGSTTWTALPGTTVISGSSTLLTAPATTVAGQSTGSASAPAATASQFDGGASQIGWNAAGVVVAGAVALFAL